MELWDLKGDQIIKSSPSIINVTMDPDQIKICFSDIKKRDGNNTLLHHFPLKLSFVNLVREREKKNKKSFVLTRYPSDLLTFYTAYRAIPQSIQ